MPRKQMTLFDDMPAPSNGVATSDEAAEAIEKDSGRLRRLVFRTIEREGGLTCQEVERITRLKHETISARIWELHTRGLLLDSGRTRRTKAKRSAIVWEVPKKKADPRCPCIVEKGPRKGLMCGRPAQRFPDPDHPNDPDIGHVVCARHKNRKIDKQIQLIEDGIARAPKRKRKRQ